MYDKAIRFENEVYSVTQTWNGPEIVVSVNPSNERLKALVEGLVLGAGQITLISRDGCFEIATSG
jgi:hypothetical protein